MAGEKDNYSFGPILALTGEEMVTIREKSHGDCDDQSFLAQQLKTTMRKALNWGALHYRQQEALEMIAVKVSRILTGDSNESDHWTDISGYAIMARDGSPGKGQK